MGEVATTHLDTNDGLPLSAVDGRTEVVELSLLSRPPDRRTRALLERASLLILPAALLLPQSPPRRPPRPPRPAYCGAGAAPPLLR